MAARATCRLAGYNDRVDRAHTAISRRRDEPNGGLIVRHRQQGRPAAGEPQASGKTYKVTGALKQGISSENAKKITKLIRDAGPKNVKTQIQGDEVRVTSKKRDDLQAVIAMLKKADLDVALQFVNYR